MVPNIDKFRGIHVAFYAFYDEQGNISAKRIATAAKWYVDKGVNGLYLTGSSGEGMVQSVRERNLVVDSVMDAVGGKTCVIVQVGAPSTKDSVALASHAAQSGADGISAVPFIYYKMPENCIEENWDAMIRAAKLPFFIYNIPDTTGYSVSLKLFEKMIAKEYVAGIKHTSESCSAINAMRNIGGANTIIFNGEDAQLLAGLSMGATGGIGGTYGCMPELYVKLYKAFCRGDCDEALLWQTRAVKAFMHGRVPYSTGVANMKAILEARGIETGGSRLPVKTVSRHEPAIQEAAAMIEAWVEEDK